MSNVYEGSIMAHKIITARKNNSYTGAVVEGSRGIGKSCYCLKVSKLVYEATFGLKDEDAWKKSLDTCMFSIRDVIRVLKSATDRNEILPCSVWDDSSVHASSLQYFLAMKEVNELRAVIETCRTATSSILLNCTDRSGLLSFLRKSDDLLITINKSQSGGYDRVSRGYTLYKLPSGKRLVHKEFEEQFSCYIPTYVYEIYYTRRKKYLREALSRMSEMTNRSEKNEKYSKLRTEIEQFSIDKRIEELREKGVVIGGETK